MSANQTHVSASLKTSAVLITNDGKRIDLGVLDYRTGVIIDLFGKRIDLTFPWTPRLWFYKYFTYRRRITKQRKGD